MFVIKKLKAKCTQSNMLKLTMNPRKRSRRGRSQSGKSWIQFSENKVMEQKSMLEENLQALLKQEASGSYACTDYLSMKTFERNVYDFIKKDRCSMHQQGDARIDEFCREQIVEWSFRVVDYFRIDREVVAVSISFLDRFLATCQCDRSTFKLAATTTLHLAVKLLHPCKLGDLGILSDLSRGEFDMYDVSEMESHILHSLKWSLHPPTPIAFSSLLLEYIMLDRSMPVTSADMDDLQDIASFFTELAVCDYHFAFLRPSEIAVASILNALEGMFGHENQYASQILQFARRMNMFQNQDLSRISHRLWELYERSEECALHNSYDPMEEEKVSGTNENVYVKPRQEHGAGSPVSVASNQSMPSKAVASNEFMCQMRAQNIRGGW